jgi:hypothetical protein
MLDFLWLSKLCGVFVTLISVDLIAKLSENHFLKVIRLLQWITTTSRSILRWLLRLLIHLNSLLDFLNKKAHDNPLEISSIGLSRSLVFMTLRFLRNEFLFVFIVGLRIIFENFSRPLLLEPLERSGIMPIRVPRLPGLIGLVRLLALP